jgi:hypothetical protein
MKTKKQNDRTAKVTATPAMKLTTKVTPKTTAKVTATAATATAKPKKTLTHDERSAIARLAAYKAHLHKSFQSERTPDERKIQTRLFESAKKTRDHVPTLDRDELLDAIA